MSSYGSEPFKTEKKLGVIKVSFSTQFCSLDLKIGGNEQNWVLIVTLFSTKFFFCLEGKLE
jgi:hypothetical protein